MLRHVLSALSGALVLFHAWLFGGQLWAGQLAEPGVIFRWAVAAGLLAALTRLRQPGASVVPGRQAVAIWLLAALLHGPAVAQRAAGYAPDLPETMALLVQMAGAALSLGALALLVAFARRRPRRRFAAIRRMTRSVAATVDPARGPLVAPRPPPFSSIFAW